MKDSKLVYKIQPLEVVVEKVLIWRYEHYLIYWLKYIHSVHSTQPT